jgi:hypothetical protein
MSLNNLGFLLKALGDLSGAQFHYERALAIFALRLGPDDPRTKIVQENLENLESMRQSAGLPQPESPPRPT